MSGPSGRTRWRRTTTWKQWPTGIQGTALRAVWNKDPTRATAVGDDGTILLWSTDHWVLQSSGTARKLHAVAGSATGDVWVVGEAGTILRRAR